MFSFSIFLVSNLKTYFHDSEGNFNNKIKTSAFIPMFYVFKENNIINALFSHGSCCFYPLGRKELAKTNL